MAARWLLLPLFVLGCGTTPPPAAPGPYRLIPAEQGLDVAGSGGREIGFGRARAGVLDSVARIEGVAPQPVACGVPGRNAVRTSSGLVLIFDGPVFVGWASEADRRGWICSA